MTIRVTVAVPETLMDAANHTHVVLGKASKPTTYTDARWQDADGNLFAVSSGLWTDAQLRGVTDPAVLGAIIAKGGVPEGVDLALVQAAQAAFVLSESDALDEDGEPIPPLTADPGKIIALASSNAADAVKALGLVTTDVF